MSQKDESRKTRHSPASHPVVVASAGQLREAILGGEEGRSDEGVRA